MCFSLPFQLYHKPDEAKLCPVALCEEQCHQDYTVDRCKYFEDKYSPFVNRQMLQLVS